MQQPIAPPPGYSSDSTVTTPEMGTAVVPVVAETVRITRPVPSHAHVSPPPDNFPPPGQFPSSFSNDRMESSVWGCC